LPRKARFCRGIIGEILRIARCRDRQREKLKAVPCIFFS